MGYCHRSRSSSPLRTEPAHSSLRRSPVTQTITMTLQTLNCIREKDSSSAPYVWTAFLWIDDPTATVGVLTPLVSDDRIVLQSNLQPGQSVAIPPSVGVLLRPFDTDLTTTQLVLVTALWQKHDTPSNVVDAGFQAFGNSLQSAIQANLLGLASSDPQTQQDAITKIKASVKDAVTNAISDSLSLVQKGEIALGLLTLDSLIDNSSEIFRSIDPQSFTITL